MQYVSFDPPSSPSQKNRGQKNPSYVKIVVNPYRTRIKHAAEGLAHIRDVRVPHAHVGDVETTPLGGRVEYTS